jgi:predicted negative regulator of RcsB-dependent stress response
VVSLYIILSLPITVFNPNFVVKISESYMSGQSAFEKRYVDPRDQSNVEGLLEHFNLPPKVISFLRQNKRAVQVVLSVVILAIVTFSLYGSYREKQIEDAASELTLALKETGTSQTEALQRVADEYAGTTSGAWAQVELAHQAVKNKDFPLAAQKYSEIHKDLKPTNPLYALTLYGIAGAEESQEKYDAAYSAFEKLKDIEGYQLTGYTGMARIHEIRGDVEKALGIYGQFLTILGDAEEKAGQRGVVEEKIARLKAKQ